MLKTVYGPPPAGEERIEAAELEEENCIREEETASAKSVAPKVRGGKEARKG